MAGGGIEPPTRNMAWQNLLFPRAEDIKNIVDRLIRYDYFMTPWLPFTKTRAANLHSFTVLSRCPTANVASNRRN